MTVEALTVDVPRTVELSDGTILPFREFGDPTGAPVVFLHGLSDSFRSFDLLAERLPRSIHGFAVTQRGHAGASAPATGYAVNELAGDVLAFMDVVGLEHSTLVGHSWGSAVALRAAVAGGARIDGVALLGAFARPAANPEVAGLEEVMAALQDPVDLEFVTGFQESTIARPVPDDFMRVVIDQSLQVPVAVFRAALGGLLHADLFADLDSIEAPVLITRGELDPFATAEEATALAAALRDARVSTYASTGHAVHWEQPERYARELASFVAACAARRSN